eukprot:scaffold21064_cov31-Tisochrysis_lutea.AAC.2
MESGRGAIKGEGLASSPYPPLRALQDLPCPLHLRPPCRSRPRCASAHPSCETGQSGRRSASDTSRKPGRRRGRRARRCAQSPVGVLAHETLSSTTNRSACSHQTQPQTTKLTYLSRSFVRPQAERQNDQAAARRRWRRPKQCSRARCRRTIPHGQAVRRVHLARQVGPEVDRALNRP